MVIEVPHRSEMGVRIGIVQVRNKKRKTYVHVTTHYLFRLSVSRHLLFVHLTCTTEGLALVHVRDWQEVFLRFGLFLELILFFLVK